MDEIKYYVFNEDGEAVRVAFINSGKTLESITNSRAYQRTHKRIEPEPLAVLDAEDAPI